MRGTPEPATAPAAAIANKSRRVGDAPVAPRICLLPSPTTGPIRAPPTRLPGSYGSEPCRQFRGAVCFCLGDSYCQLTQLPAPLAGRALASGAFQGEVFVRRGVRETRHQAEPRLTYPRSDTVDKGQLPNRCVDHPLGHDLLDLVEQRAAPRLVKLDRLLLEQRVDVGVVAVGV